MSNKTSGDLSVALAEQVKSAYANDTVLNIGGGGTKSFLYDNELGEDQCELISISGHQGIIHYEPNELVLTARAGTPLKEIKELLRANKQMLAFEPPSFGDAVTFGGTIACALSGSRRPYTGAARDFVLGVRIINGRGENIHFGGEVIKNVAGYDVSRLMTGAMGTLGILLDISIKVLPAPEVEMTLVQELSPADARKRMIDLAREYLPISGMSYVGKFLSIRLSGTKDTVETISKKIGGEHIHDYGTYWKDILEQQHPFFGSGKTLWRLSLPATNSWHEINLKLAGDYLIDWGGALIWFASDDPVEKLFSYAKDRDGHGQVFRNINGSCESRHQPLSASLMRWHKKLKNAFDPKGIFNPGRMYKDL